LNIKELQNSVEKWNIRNFGVDKPSYMALLKIQEELGETSAHYIGRTEHRVGKAIVDHNAGIIDGVADILISLCVFCSREHINLDDSVTKVWDEVSKRSFVTK